MDFNGNSQFQRLLLFLIPLLFMNHTYGLEGLEVHSYYGPPMEVRSPAFLMWSCPCVLIPRVDT